LRLAFSLEDLAYKGPLPANMLDHFVVRFGVSDLPSLVYWLAR
jgi:hypothetical protein